MKKIITLCFFAFALFFGTQTMTAQSDTEVNSMAAKKTQELKDVVKFNKKTENLVYAAFQDNVRKRYTYDAAIAKGHAASPEALKKIEAKLSATLKNVLTTEEFRVFTEFQTHKTAK